LTPLFLTETADANIFRHEKSPNNGTSHIFFRCVILSKREKDNNG